MEAWEARRKAWTTPNEQYLSRAEELKEKHEQRQKLVLQEVHRIAIYKRLVLQRQTLRTPLGLPYLIPVLVTGWQEDGLWPKGMVVEGLSD